MSIRSRSTRPRSSISAPEVYLRGFHGQVHQLLWMGYERMQPVGRFSTWNEEDLSEVLGNAIQAAIEDPAAPIWAHRYAIHPEHPISHVLRRGKPRRGKARPLIDIELERTMPGRHPRFQFEAKRLRGRASRAVSEYLSDRGLGCFLSGTYARDWDEAGMLGYVQAGRLLDWASRIEQRLRQDPLTLHVTEDGQWASCQLVAALASTYRTLHDRPPVQRSIAIYHTLLVFR